MNYGNKQYQRFYCEQSKPRLIYTESDDLLQSRCSNQTETLFDSKQEAKLMRNKKKNRFFKNERERKLNKNAECVN